MAKKYKNKRSRKPKNTRGVIYNPRKGFGPLGKSFIATLTFCETVAIDASTGVSNEHIFSANGIARPDITGLSNTHQPYGVDQLAPFFKHYTVVGSKCTVKAVNNNTIPIYIGCVLRDNQEPITLAADTLLEQGGVNLQLVGGQTGGNNKMTRVMKFSPKTFFGKSKGTIVGDSLLRGNLNTTASTLDMPDEQAFYHIMVVPQAGGDNPNSQIVQVQIEYTVVLTEPDQLHTS